MSNYSKLDLFDLDLFKKEYESDLLRLENEYFEMPKEYINDATEYVKRSLKYEIEKCKSELKNIQKAIRDREIEDLIEYEEMFNWDEY
ncbi:hypothetical protein [Cytobacillus praedii]|uniref:hypothetical protein n=1 Tax=Cytobacillus praedii TaxID=1742358 RepID=UPI00103ADC97|nr:hypothetical protein [Cytobacillus praedii]